MMKGLELSEKYFFEYGLPLIKDKFGAYIDRIAAGLVGEGSECLGFDDEISKDHDWGPRFCIWLTSGDFSLFGAELQQELNNLPKSYGEYGSVKVSGWGEGRSGVFEIPGFYQKFIGIDHLPGNVMEWIVIPENFLGTVTNGKVFHDPYGEFSRWRNTLLAFYPDDVRLKIMAFRCMNIAQSGQYNYPRSLKRNELYAARYSIVKFTADVISLVFTLNRKYVPFYKWMHKGVRSLPILGPETYTCVSDLITGDDNEKKITIIENICELIIKEFKKEGLSDSGSDFLLDHGPIIHARIKDPRLKARNVWII